MGDCPVCHGSDRSPIAPGYWQCESIVTDYQAVMGPAPGAPPALGMMSPVPYAYQRVCRHRYHLATDLGDDEMQYCACETGAIGRCANDHKPVCGDHSTLRAGRRLCMECAGRFDADQAAAAAEAKRNAVLEELRPWLDEVRAICAALRKLPDPTDRFLILQSLAQHAARRSRTDGGAVLAADELGPILNAAADELLGKRSSPFWDAISQHPGSWRMKPRALIPHWEQSGRLRTRGKVRLRITSWQKGIFGGMKRVTLGQIEGWQIRTGSLGTSGTYGSAGSPDVYVLTDGTLGSTAYRTRDLAQMEGGREIDNSDVWMLHAADHLASPPVPAEVATAIQSLTGIPFPVRR